MKKVSVGSALAAFLVSASAFAQPAPQPAVPPAPPVVERDAPPRGVPVQERARPDYDALGVRLGSFILLPSIEVSEEFTDNVYATDEDEQSDFITEVSPNLVLQSDWSNHSLALSAGADIGMYAEYENENYNDYILEAEGSLDVVRGTQLLAELSQAYLHEERGSPDDVGALEPTTYHRTIARVGAERAGGRIGARLEGGYTRLDFDEIRTATGTTSNPQRDRDIFDVEARLSYEFVPDVAAFVEGQLNERNYDDNKTNESQGYEVNVGASFDLGGITTGEVFVGYLKQRYDDEEFDDISGLSLGAAVLWNVTELTSVRFDVERTVEETISADSAGYLSTAVGVRVDHELRRNILLNADATYINDNFNDEDDRNDNTYRFGVGGHYLFTRNFYAGAEYDFVTRNSSEEDEDYNENRVMLRLGAQI